MRSRPFRFLLAVSVFGAGGALVACGGDDAGGGGTEAVSIEEFCDRIAALESAAEPDDIGAAVGAIEGLVDAAPTDEVREALETLVPVLSRMGAIDENDPDAISELMGLAMDPEVMAASTVLEKFGTEQCGFSADDPTSGDDLGSAESTPEFSFDEGADPSLAAFETEPIREFLEASAVEFLNGGSISSITVLGEGEGYSVTVDATSSSGVAAVPICELLVDFYDSNAPGVDVTIEVMTEGLPAVLRQPGGICES
jgi:hypothetical protein